MFGRWLSSSQPIGCDLGKRHIRMAQVHAWRSGAVRVTAESRAIPADCVEDPERRRAALPRLLRDMLRASDFRGRDVVSVLPSETLWYRTMRLAPMPDGELATAAHWVAAKELGTHADSFKSAAFRLGAVKESGAQKMEVAAIGADLRTLDEHAEMFVQAGMTPLAIDAASCAAARLLTDDNEAVLNPAGCDPLLILDVGHQATTLAIACRGTVKFLRGFRGGAARVVELLAQRLGITLTQAQAICDADATAAAAGAAPSEGAADEAPAREAADDAWRMFARELARDISLSLHHYCDSLGGAPPPSATTVGPCAAPEDFRAALGEATGLEFRQPAALLSPRWAQALNSSPEQLGTWVVACGLSTYCEVAMVKGKAS
jgi:Tfp pilus assembly PilM family ATPase